MSAEDGDKPRAGASDAVAPEANAGGETAPPNVIGPERDDLSFPPVDFDAAFFARPQRTSHELAEEWARDPAADLMASPLAKRRRAQLKKYVSLAMGLASAVCLAALVKGALTSPEGSSGPQRHFSAAAESVPRSLPEPVAEQERAPQPTAPAPELVAPAPAAPAPELVAALPAAPAAELVGPAPAAPAAELAPPAPTALAPESVAPQEEPKAGNETPAPDPGEALKQKRASRVALERGRTAASIEAGEHAVRLDPLDADAWLILGAAYQQKGDLAEARRCYKACVERGQRGDRRECIAMLR
jgi:tetratricopeptide (TPR) repeat protein